MKWLWITLVVLIAETYSIQTRVRRPVRFIDQKAVPSRHFRHIDASSSINFDWEHGLREATVQALFREHVGDHNLRKHIYTAPLLGKQDKATPFGDIAVLARGQLYANYAGYIFVQDRYHNDCDDCHNIETEPIRERCINNRCQIWHPRNNEQLIALWSIKRIRHRSAGDRFGRLELEFTISPAGLRHPKEAYITKEGTFNYNLPGHIFILKSPETHQNLDSVQNVNHFTHGAFIAQTPDGRKYILHSFPGILTPEAPRYPTTPKDSSPTSTTSQYSEEDPKKVYQTLLEILHKKTSLEPNRFTPPTPKTSTTALVQFPDGQVVPITELQTPFTQKTTPGYVTVRFPETSPVSSPEQPKDQTTTLSHPLFKPTTSHMISQTSIQTTQAHPQTTFTTKLSPTTTVYTTPHQAHPQTTFTTKLSPTTNVYTTPQQAHPQTTFTTKLSSTTNAYTSTTPQHTTFFSPPTTGELTPQTPNEFYTNPTTVNNVNRPQYSSTTQDVTLATTKLPVKMTFHYFAAEEEQKTTPEVPKKVLTTVPQHEYTENFLQETAVPTEPTKVFTTEIETTQEFKETTKYQAPITRTPFTTFGSVRPATIVKVTKPFTETTYSSPKTLPTYHSTEPSTNTIKEPSTTAYYTTRKPYSDFTVPITVLEESLAGITLQEKYPITNTETFTRISTASIREPTTITAGSTKYTNTQFYNPTTKQPSEEGTTISLQGTTTTVFESKEPTTLFTDDTTYTKVPTLETNKGTIETTLGVTTFMGTAQNKTTEMVYYAAEETELPTKYIPNTTPTRFTETTSSSIGSTQPTSTAGQTETVSTPKRIVTTIGADGTVSIKTTPFYAEEELFGLTKGSTKKYKPTKSYKVSTTEASDFLAENGSQKDSNIPLYKKPLKDYSEDDIFGPTKSTYTKTSKKTGVTREYTKSDLEQALFDSNSRRAKALIRRKSSTTESTPSKVIYANYFEASTLAMTTQPPVTTLPSVGPAISPVTMTKVRSVVPRKSFSVSKRPKLAIPRAGKVEKQGDIEKTIPVTSQSYMTSISYEVNKTKKTLSSQLKEHHGNATSENKNRDEQLKMEKRMDVTRSTKSNLKEASSKNQTDREIENDFALRLISQAKGVAYLDEIATTGASTIASTSPRTTKKPKYTRRRTYVSRAKRPTRKKIVKDGDNR